MVFCEMRGDRIFQLSIPSVSANNALHVKSGCGVLADINVAPTHAKVVLSLVVGLCGTLTTPMFSFGWVSLSSDAPPINIATLALVNIASKPCSLIVSELGARAGL